MHPRPRVPQYRTHVKVVFEASIKFESIDAGFDRMDTMNRSDGIAGVREQIAAACRDAGRDPATVTLVAISKTFGADAIAPVIAAGQRVFGENRVQEAKAKWPPLIARHGAGDGGLELHLVGPLQSNKAKEAVALF